LISEGKSTEDPKSSILGHIYPWEKGRRGRSLIYISRKMRFKRSDFERVTKNTAVGTLLE
jgi:hypothetical protein